MSRRANINTSTQLINLGDNAGGGSRCGDTDASPLQVTFWKQMFQMSLPVRCGAVAQWAVFQVMPEVFFDSCNFSSLIPLGGLQGNDVRAVMYAHHHDQ